MLQRLLQRQATDIRRACFLRPKSEKRDCANSDLEKNGGESKRFIDCVVHSLASLSKSALPLTYTFAPSLQGNVFYQ